ncbi:MAG: response regulator [Planctomycetes bacterium]|nr:response regulator [Planctomycetota bacterium]
MFFNKIKFWLLLLPLLAVLVFLMTLPPGSGPETRSSQANPEPYAEYSVSLNRFELFLEREVKEYSEIAFLGNEQHFKHLEKSRDDARKALAQLQSDAMNVLQKGGSIDKGILDQAVKNYEKLALLGDRLAGLAARGESRLAAELFENEIMPLSDYSILLDIQSLSAGGPAPGYPASSPGRQNVWFLAGIVFLMVLLPAIWLAVYLCWVRNSAKMPENAVFDIRSAQTVSSEATPQVEGAVPDEILKELAILKSSCKKYEEESGMLRAGCKRANDELDVVKESRVKTERELRGLKEEAAKLQKENAELLVKVNKRIEDPLDAISGFADHIISTINNIGTKDAEDEIQNHIAITQNLLNRINDIVAVAEIDMDKLQVDLTAIGVADIIQNSFETIKPYAQLRGIDAGVEPYDADLSVRADFLRVRQAMLTLLFNAVNASKSKRIMVAVAQNSGMLEVIIRDGAGWQDSSIICLGFVKKIAELHDGVFEEKNADDTGGVFKFSIPVAGRQLPDAPVPVISIQPKFGANAPHILLFGQEPQVVRMLEKAVTEEGIRVSTVNSYTKVVKTARELMPSAIMLDLLKPGEGILQALMDLKEIKSTKDIPVFVVTMCNDNEIIFNLGSVEYIEKPVRKVVLQMLMERMLNKKSGARIAVIDDTDEDRLLVRKHLAGTGFEIDEYKDGNTAVREIARNVPDLVIIDLIMPGHDGFCVIANLTENSRTANIPTIIISNKELEDMEHEILRHKTTVIVKRNRMPGAEFIKTVKKTVAVLKQL